MKPTESAIDLIMQERLRQIKKEKFDRAHDDGHVDGQLAGAASSYALTAAYAINTGKVPTFKPAMWPWDDDWFKPKGPIEDLVRAGALIVAEIERLQRMERDIAKAEKKVVAAAIEAGAKRK